jgi:hypothetical protein
LYLSASEERGSHKAYSGADGGTHIVPEPEPPVLVSKDGLFWHPLKWEYEVRMDILMPENEDGDNAGDDFFEGTADSNYQSGIWSERY